jgi:dipeptidyl aminopeptidase/acylaminoacyl peptidase
MTLLAMGRLPGRFAGGLAHVAMADWAAAWADMNPALRGAWTAFLGGRPDEVPDVLARMSAVNFVDQVTGSVWLNQGARDTRTPAAQAQRYADLLAAAGGDVSIDWFDAGHEPTGLAGMGRDQERMEELVDRSLAGERWDE